MKETVALAERYSMVKYEELPAQSVEKAKECLIDYLGCTYAGWLFESSRIACEYAIENYAQGNCTVIGRTEKLVPGGACFINGTTGHTAELDDCSNEGGGHPGVTIIPVALAMGEHAGLSGKDVLRCMIIGYDTFIKIGKASNHLSLFDRGYHPTALLGMFGSAMTAARALNLSIEKTANALGIVGCFVAGDLECFSDGSFTKRLHGGTASSAGVTAAILASKGYTGPKSILEGPRGFFHAYCENPRLEELAKTDDAFEIEKISFEPHACCRYNQACIDAVLEIFSQSNLNYRKVESILVELAKNPYDIVGQPIELKFSPKSVVDAQFSAPYSVAIACIEKRAFLEEYSDEWIRNPEVTELMRKIAVKYTPELDRFFPESFPTRLTVRMDDGKTFIKEVLYPKGDPENPLSWEELLEKFDNLAPASMKEGRKQQIVETIRNLDKIRNITNLTGLLG